MGKALVLKNIDFSANKLDTVTFIEDIPCTGLTLSLNSLTYTELTTTTLTATLTPANTTDILLWSSSNEEVATVSNGVVTAIGLGAATISVSCGNQSATCNVSVTVVLTESSLVKLLHRYNSGTNLSLGKDYLGCYGEESGGYLKCSAFLSSNVTPSGYKALSGTNTLYDNKYPIIIPKNAAYIEFTASTLTLDTLYYSWIDSTTLPTYSTSGKGCRALSNIFNTTNVSNNKIKISIPTDIDDLDSIVFGLKFTTSITDSTDTSVTVSFLTE